MFGAKDMYGFSSLFMTKHLFGLLQTFNEFSTNFVKICPNPPELAVLPRHAHRPLFLQVVLYP